MACLGQWVSVLGPLWGRTPARGGVHRLRHAENSTYLTNGLELNIFILWGLSDFVL